MEIKVYHNRITANCVLVSWIRIDRDDTPEGAADLLEAIHNINELGQEFCFRAHPSTGSLAIVGEEGVVYESFDGLTMDLFGKLA